MNGIDTDVCVVGGGPAGLALALLLLRSGARVAVVERATSLEREYRGEILQPGGLAVLDELGVLDAVRRRGGCELTGFQLCDGKRVLMDIDYTRLPGPHNRLLSLPQHHLLAGLLAACEEFDTFRHLAGHRLRELVRDGDGAVAGVLAAAVAGAADGGEPVRVDAGLVVAADGRHSKARRLAGIDAGRLDVFEQDVLWFKLHAPGAATGKVRIFRTGGSAAIVHDSHPDRLQIGWCLPHGGYGELAREGLPAVRARLCAALPELAEPIGEQLDSVKRLSLLDVFAGSAERWAADGLLLIGDAAHTLGPLGAQGINLALQDAVLAHPVVLRALDSGDAGAEALSAFERVRRPDIERVLKMQKMQAKGMFAEPNPVADLIRPAVAGLIGRTPVGARITRRIAFGNPGIRVRTDLFAAA
ncbi:FAD-dependent monooxygenase [Kitasatospora sp. NPDC056446]|uniref:FAD-dependent monooxygenase n=1 Tax=Kitasatospora sp. NPDC056446 TaxID=3345819 RepID=UPI00367E75D0